MTYDSEVLADSPWAYWSTTEASGTITDDSGNGRDLSLPGGSPTYAQSGPASGADAMLWPDSSGGTEYYATRTSAPSAGPQSYECWFYYSGTAPTNPTPLVGLAFGYGNNSRRPVELFIGTDGKLKAITGQSTAVSNLITDSNVLTTGWHHAVLVAVSGAWKIRLDKVDVASSSTAVSFTSGGTVYIHGGGFDADSLAGDLRNGGAIKISKVAVYTSGLSNTRIDAHYDAMIASGTATSATGSISFSGTAGARAAAGIAGSLEFIGEKISNYDLAVRNDGAWTYSRGKDPDPDTEVLDFSGNRRTLTPHGVLQSGDGPRGDAQDGLAFGTSSSDSYVVSSDTVGSPQDEVTLEGWFVPVAGVNPAPIVALCPALGGFATAVAVLYYTNTNQVHLLYGNSGSAQVISSTAAPAALDLNGWNHIVAQLTPTGAKIRVNKVDVASGSHGFELDPAAKFYIHAGGGDGIGFNSKVGMLVSKAAAYLSTLSDADTDEHYDLMDLPQDAGATGSITFSGIVGTTAPVAGIAGGISFSGTAAAAADGAAEAAGAITFSGTAGASLGAGAEGGIDFSGAAGALAVVDGDDSNVFGGLDLGGGAIVTLTPPVVVPPYVPETVPVLVDKAIAFAEPELVKGRPT